MFTPHLAPALVRIFMDHFSQPVGAGFLVSPRHILTCAHVITAALRIPQDTALPPSELIHLDFPLLPQHPHCQARVIRWHPVNTEVIVGESEDIAVLELIETLPTDARPVPLVRLVSSFDREVRLCGFPEGKEMGVYVNATLQGVIGRGYVQLNTELGHGQVAPGFSGTAVWDKQENGIVGMVVSIDNFQGDVPAYMIPTSTLIQAYPDLDVHSRPPNPYRGLATFREQDADLFFGRAQMVKELVTAVEQQAFVTVIGASGSGKSSVVFAGLIPHLRSTDQWLIASLRPRVQPFLELATALVPWLYQDKLEQAEKLDEFSRKLETGPLTLSSIFQLIQHASPHRRLLLIIDQFEELYTLTADKTLQQRFVDVLLQPLPSPHCVPLITLRADFMGQVLAHDTFVKVLKKYPDTKLERMTDQELTEAIERPADQLGVKLDEGLTERILGELGREPGNLPLLEFALTQLWERQQSRQLTHEAYHAMGGVQRALTHYADEVYQQLAPPDQERMRHVLVQLVRPGEGTEDTRQVARLTQFSAAYHPLVVQLADQRLVVTDKDEQQRETVEVVHEALIRHWQPLREWMDKYREFRLWQENLRQYMKDQILLRGTPLAIAQERLQQQQMELSEEERAFVQQSIAQQEVEQTEKERQIQLLQEQRDRALITQSLFLADLSRQEVERGNATNGILLALEALPKDMSSPDRPYLVEAEERLYNAVAHLRERIVFKHSEYESVSQAIFSHDGKYIVTISGGLTQSVPSEMQCFLIKLWDVDTGELIVTMAGHESSIHTVALSQNGKYLVTASADKTARLWDVRNGKQIDFVEHHDIVNDATFDPSSQLIVTASDDKTACVWNIGTTEKKIISFDDKITQVIFSPNGRHVVLVAREYPHGVAYLLDISCGQSSILKTDKDKDDDTSHYVTFSPHGQYVVIASFYGVKIWDTSTGKYLIKIDTENAVKYAIFSPDSKHILTVSFFEGTLGSVGAKAKAYLWDANTGEKISTLSESSYQVEQAAFSPDGHQIATASDDNMIRLWSHRSEQPEVTFSGHEAEINSIIYSTDGKKILTSSNDGTARLWEIEILHRPLVELSVDGLGSDARIAFSSDNQRLIVAPYSETNQQYENFQAWEVGTGKLSNLRSGDEQVLIETDRQNQIFNQEYNQLISERYFDNTTIETIPNKEQTRVIIGKFKDVAYLWDFKICKPLGTLYGAGEGYFWVTHAAFSMDGSRIATMQRFGHISIWHAFPTTQALIDYANQKVPRQLTPKQRKKFFL